MSQFAKFPGLHRLLVSTQNFLTSFGTGAGSTDEDQARREFILNVLLTACITLLAFAVVISTVKLFFANPVEYMNNGYSLAAVVLTLAFFLFLRALSRRGRSKIAAYLFISTFFLLASNMAWHWGVDLEAALLFYMLMVIIAGILIDSRFSLLMTMMIGATLLGINELHRHEIVLPNRYWRNMLWGTTDVLMATLIFAVTATVAWLSNREISKALKRARVSEAALKMERDQLEVTVEKRTEELRTAQMEKIAQLYRFAEFGKLASGLFHDLTNQVTALSLNVEHVKQNTPQASATKSSIDRAGEVSERMKQFVSSVRKQMSGSQNELRHFSLKTELEQAVQLLSYKARQQKVDVETDAGDICYEGDSFKFNQIVSNLLSNAIDAYKDLPESMPRRVAISLTATQDKGVELTVMDWGSGIKPDIKNKLFQPFFTTKDFSSGTGLGLSLTKQMVEKDFGGTITVESEEHKYTKFTIRFPAPTYVNHRDCAFSASVKQTSAA